MDPIWVTYGPVLDHFRVFGLLLDYCWLVPIVAQLLPYFWAVAGWVLVGYRITPAIVSNNKEAASSNPAIIQKHKMGQNWSISDPNGVQMGSNGFPYQFGSIRTKSHPKRTNGDPKQPIFHFWEGRFWIDFQHFRRTRSTFRKMVRKWVRDFSGIEILL